MLSSYRCHIYFHEIRNVSHLWNNFWKHFSTALKPWNFLLPWMYQGILTLYIPCLLTKKRRIKRWKSQKDAEWERVSDWEKERVRRKLKELRFSCVYHKNKNVNGGKPRSRSSFHGGSEWRLQNRYLSMFIYREKDRVFWCCGNFRLNFSSFSLFVYLSSF